MFKKVDLICHSKDGSNGGCGRLVQLCFTVSQRAKATGNANVKNKKDVSMSAGVIL